MSASVSLSLSPELVVCARCSCVMLSPGFLIPSPLHCPTAPPQGCGNPQRPVDADSLMRWPQCTLCPWRWLGCGQAGGGAARGPVSVCARWRSMLRSGTCPPILPHVLSPPSKAHGCVFFFLFFLAFSSVFSLALPLSFLLSLSFSVLFCIFLSRREIRLQKQGCSPFFSAAHRLGFSHLSERRGKERKREEVNACGGGASRAREGRKGSG